MYDQYEFMEIELHVCSSTNMCNNLINTQEVSIVLVYWISVYRHIWHRLLQIHICRLIHSTLYSQFRYSLFKVCASIETIQKASYKQAFSFMEEVGIQNQLLMSEFCVLNLEFRVLSSEFRYCGYPFC